MMKIMLACSAGMSTSLLVTKMEASAKERGIEAKIWAISEAQVRNHIEECDVILLGPQVRFLLNKVKDIAKPYGVPVDAINMAHYGRCDGASVLDTAIKMYNDK